MMEQNTYRDRVRAGAPTLAIHLLLGLALIFSLGAEPPAPEPEAMKLINLSPPVPPPVQAIPSERERSRRREGAASPPNLEARRTDVVVPPQVVPPTTRTIIAAEIPDVGAAPSAGSATVPGPGTGSGGQGTGTGSGGRGTGPGGGGDGDGDGLGGRMTPPRRIRGRISDSDYPRALGAAGIGGTVSVIYTVETDGRATHCMITDSSGNAELDGTTCRLIEQRFRFEPSRDRFGRAIRSRIVQDHYWETQDEEPEPERPQRRRSRW